MSVQKTKSYQAFPIQRRLWAFARYIEEYAAAHAAASPAERELEALQRKTRLSADELVRLHELSLAQISGA